MNENHQLEVAGQSLINSLDDMDRVSKSIAASGMFGVTKPEQAMTLMLICQAEGLNPIAALRRYHLIEGRPSMRADAMQGEFEAKGAAIIWHVRTDEMVAATAFLDKKAVDEKARERAVKRFDVLWALESEGDNAKRSKLMVEIAKLSREGEETLIRTYADAEAKGITLGKNGTKANWSTSPRQMLTARVVTELVRLLNPGLIAGIYSEDETEDIVRQEKEAKARIIDSPSPRDREAIQAIIAQYDEEMKTEITKARRQELLGLRSELVCKLADLDVTTSDEPKPEAMPVETTVEPPPKAARTPRATRNKTTDAAQTPQEPVNQAAEEPADETPWQEVVCHVGSATGTLFGRPLGQLLKADRSEKNILGLVDYFKGQVGNLTAPNAKDAALWKAVQAAHQWWNQEQVKLPQTPATATQPANNPDTTPKPADPTPASEGAHGWREYVIKSKSPDWNGKTLGSLTLAQLQTLESEYLSKIDPSRETHDQRALKANVALALIEVEMRLPDGIPTHTARLLTAITESKLNRNDFIKECQREGYIRETYSKIEEITEDEAHSLLAEWQSVEKLVRAAMP